MYNQSQSTIMLLSMHINLEMPLIKKNGCGARNPFSENKRIRITVHK